MTSDLDIYRSAHVLIREHGGDAALEAAERADAMLEPGDLEGKALWLRVLNAVEEMQRKELREDEAAHEAVRHYTVESRLGAGKRRWSR
jgi:hypothetical protein